MLSFATEFPIDVSQTPRDFVEAVKHWILHSPHTRFTAAQLDEMPMSGSWSTTNGGEKIVSLSVSTANEDASAVRHINFDGELTWETTIVLSRSPSDAWVSIRTSRESHHPAVRLPPAKKPVVVRTLLERLGGGLDGNLLVSDEPRFLTNGEIALASSLIAGEAGCHLPVVYVSCGSMAHTFMASSFLRTASLVWPMSSLSQIDHSLADYKSK